jgi:hypothetical protein
MQITGQLTGSLVVQHFDDAETRADDLDPISKKLLDAVACFERKQYKSAASYAADAIDMITSQHGVHL